MTFVKKYRWLIALLIVLSSGALGWFYMRSAPQPVYYLTEPAVRADIEDSVLAVANLQAARLIDVGAQVSGQLKSIRVVLGESVKKGQLLAEIDPVLSEARVREVLASLEGLEAQRRSGRANLKRAELALRRQRAMLGDEATSAQELESAEANLESAQASVAGTLATIKQTTSQLDSERAKLAFTQILAPMDGDIVAVVAQEGQTIIAEQTAPVIFKLANVQSMLVKAKVSEADVIRVRVGGKAYFTILGDESKRYDSQISAIEPAPADFQNGATTGAASAVFYNAQFEIANPDRVLRIGMTAQVVIVLSEAKNALTIPATALDSSAQSPAKPAGTGAAAQPAAKTASVRVLQDGVARERVITLGINNNVRVEVLSGLKENEQVVTGDDAIDATEPP
jgi:membrane fusion protein, macrolide-specific efflux system